MDLSKDWKKLLGFALLVMGAVYFYKMKSKDRPAAVARSSSVISNSDTPQKPVVEFIDTSAKPESTTRLQAERKAQNIRIKLGLQAIPAKNLGDKIKFAIRPRSFARGCGMGDFDLIKTLATGYKEKEFVVSIEPLVSGKRDIQHFRYSLGDIMNGKISEAIVPKMEHGARDYGIYLCYDSKNSNECAYKKTLGPRYWAGVLKPKADNNKILYFQMVTVRGDVPYLIPTKTWNDATMKVLKKQLQPIIEAEASLTKLKDIMDDLSSMPATATATALEIPLPYTSPNCG